MKEGIDTLNITYADNTPLLDLHLSKPMGLYALLDEESMFPNSSDLSLGGVQSWGGGGCYIPVCNKTQ